MAQATAEATQQTQQTVSPADARTFLSDFVPDAEALKAMEDEKVIEYYDRVKTRTDKSTSDALAKAKADAEKQQQQQQENQLDLKLPEKTTLTQSDLDEIAATAKQRGLSKEQAQALVAERHEFAGKIETRQQEALQARRGEWQEAVKADKDLGGDNLATTQRLSMLPIEKFMSSELRDLLKTTGFGDNPHVVRFLRDLGKAMSEDKPENGIGIGAGKKSAETVLYGETQQS